MARLTSLRWSVLILVMVCWSEGLQPAEAAGCCPSQTTCTTNPNPSTCTITAPANACLNSIKKGFFPNFMNPTATVYIFKYLAASQSCDLAAPANSAFCNPASLQSVSRVDASAFGAQIANSPSCSWTCPGACGMIATGPGDGLPVELMEFSVEDETANGSAAESGEETEDDEAR